ncbi:MAG: glycosyltransferase family protein [Myxococcota bacterium]
MNVLYGVVGEGMGHATRSRVVLEHLVAQGHQIRVVVSGRAHAFLTRAFAEQPSVKLFEIEGLHLDFDDGGLDLVRSLASNLASAPRSLVLNLDQISAVFADGVTPDVAISDFESWAYFYARWKRIPVISIDNMQVLNRCANPPTTTAFASLDFRLAKLAVKAKLPGAYHYLITSFFFPRVRKPRTTLVPPILRPIVLQAVREPQDHVLVYQTSPATREVLVPVLRSLPGEFRVYGTGREGVEGNVRLMPFSEAGFVDDLRTARAVIANGGLSLMGEAVHLHVPMMSIPIAGQFEQELNARWLAELGYGMWSPSFEPAAIALFLGGLSAFSEALERFEPRGNEMLVAAVDELLARVARGEPRPDRLDTIGMGAYGAGSSDDS